MIDLSVFCKVSASTVALSYNVRNACSEAVFVCSVPIDASRHQYPGQAYTALSEDRTHLVLTLGFSTLPYDRQVEFAACGLFRRLGVGEELDGSILISLPVLEWNAYSLATDNGRHFDSISVKHVLLSMAYICDSQIMRVTALNQTGLFVVVGRMQKLRRTAELPTAIPVVERAWPFPRERVSGISDQ